VGFKVGRFEGILKNAMGRLGVGSGSGGLFRVDELAGVSLGLVVVGRKNRG
jgi:hypothetical protein